MVLPPEAAKRQIPQVEKERSASPCQPSDVLPPSDTDDSNLQSAYGVQSSRLQGTDGMISPQFWGEGEEKSSIHGTMVDFFFFFFFPSISSFDSQ